MTQPFEAKDLLLHKTVNAIDCAYHAGLAACSITSLQGEKDTSTSAIWLYPADGSAPRPMTAGVSNDDHPRWSPDERQLAFISDRAGNTQVFVMPRDGGEARQVTYLDGQVVAFEWTGDGESMLVSLSQKVDPNLRGARPATQATEPPEDGPQVVWRLSYKADGLGYTLDREIHLFHVDVATGQARQLTNGPFNVRSAQGSPDGKWVVYTRTREDDEAHRTDVWVMDSDGGNVRQLTHAQAQVLSPQWSPDGRWIVFAGTEAEGDAQVRLWIIDLESGNVQALGDDSLELAGEADSVQFDPGDSSRVFAVVARRGVQEILEISVPQGVVKLRVGGERQLSKLACARDFMVYTAASPVEALEIYRCRADGSDEQCLSTLNTWWKERPRAKFERRQFEVPDGNGGTEQVDGWLIRPENAQGATPLLVDAHGGPASFALFDYGPVAYWSMLWAQGWSILALNPVGSTSYGRDFCDRLRGHWGELDLPQHLAAVQALQQQGITDDRVALVGKSYGGYLSCWALGHTDVFKAVVAGAPISHIEAHWGTSDGGYFSDNYAMGADDDCDAQLMRKLSPLEYLRGSQVPTLLLQGRDDARCPPGQAEAVFVALRRGGNRNCELVLYPETGHKFTTQGKPSQRIDAMERIAQWVTRWVT